MIKKFLVFAISMLFLKSKTFKYIPKWIKLKVLKQAHDKIFLNSWN